MWGRAEVCGAFGSRAELSLCLAFRIPKQALEEGYLHQEPVASFRSGFRCTEVGSSTPNSQAESEASARPFSGESMACNSCRQLYTICQFHRKKPLRHSGPDEKRVNKLRWFGGESTAEPQFQSQTLPANLDMQAIAGLLRIGCVFETAKLDMGCCRMYD